MRKARRISMVKCKEVAGVLKVVNPTIVLRILRWRTTTSVPEMRKLNNYFFQSKKLVQLWALRRSEEEMRIGHMIALLLSRVESIPSSCADLDELNKVHIDLGLYLIRKRQQELEVVEISDWTTTDVFFMVPACGMSWENAFYVYVPCMLTKYKHWVALMIDLVKCEIKVYDSMVLLIPDEILKEELALLSIMITNILNTFEFYEEGFYANDCSRDWWCPWPIECVDVPQQSNQ
ncbi:hypothetical protein L3X38_026485 [Prunus dulcis]|uniref:Ubiquitin-like protease family profile domain-containing protein n=1 Tax=Prunus dulcis TaxID=3755 RepID=A0AAD4VL53_PRUDU|nr:hypothetical protein L3X38_026485 [Prunus dulcis]